MRYDLYCDGSVINNGFPNQKAHIVVTDADGIVLNHEYIGEKSINIAEYSAVIWALEYSKKNGIKSHVHTDSRLIIGHVFDHWNCADHLSPLRDKVIELLRDTGAKLEWISRDSDANTASKFFKNQQKEQRKWKRKLKK